MFGWGKDSKKEPEPAPPKPAPAVQTGTGAQTVSPLKDVADPPPPRPAAAPAVSHPPAPAASRPPAAAPGPGAVSLEDVLIDAGAITPEQLHHALEEQAQHGGFLGQILIDLKYINDDSLTSFITKHCQIPHLSLLDFLIEPDIVKLVPKEICQKYCILPIDKMGRNLTIAMVNPLDPEAMDAVRKACPDLRIKPILCAYNHFKSVAQKCFAEEGSKGGDELSLSSLGIKSVARGHQGDAQEAPHEAAPAPEPEPEPEEEESPAAVSEPAAPPAKKHVEGEALLDTLFGQRSPAPAAPKMGESLIAEPGAFVDFGGDATAVAVPTEYAAPTEEVTVVAMDDDKALEGKTLIDTIFYRRKEKEVRQEGASREKGAAPTMTDSSLLVREMLTVMQDSMCDTYAMLARRMDLFRGLNPADVAKIFARGMTSEFNPGDVVFRKGEPGDKLFVILGGKVGIYDGDLLLASLSKGDMFGEMALWSNAPRSATALTEETTSVLVLSHDAIHNILSKEAAIQILENIVITLSQRLRLANQQREQAAVQM